MTPSQRRRLGLAVRVLLTAAILYVILTRIDLERFRSDLCGADPWRIAGVALFSLLCISLRWARLAYVARVGAQRLTGWQTLRMVLAGISLGLLTPGGMGEMGRGLGVAGDHDSVAVAGVTGLERSFSFAGAVGIAIVAMILSGYGTLLKWIPIVAGHGVVLFLLMHPYRLAAFTQRLMPRLPSWARERTTAFVQRFLKGWEMAGRRAALVVLSISVVHTLLILTQMTLCYFAVCGEGPWLKVFGAWAVVLGAKHFLPITVGDIGVREGLALAVFANRQLLTSPALVAALIIYALNVLLPAFLGALVLARRRSAT